MTDDIDVVHDDMDIDKIMHPYNIDMTIEQRRFLMLLLMQQLRHYQNHLSGMRGRYKDADSVEMKAHHAFTLYKVLKNAKPGYKKLELSSAYGRFGKPTTKEGNS